MSIVVACATAAPVRAQTGEIVGQVVEQGTDRPIAGAVVRLGTVLETETDDQGLFRFASVLPGRHALRVIRLGYREHSTEVAVESGQASRIRLTVSEQAIALTPLTAEALTADQAAARGAGYSRGVVTRQQIARWEGTNMKLGDVLRVGVPSVRVRSQESRVGTDVCIELRTVRATPGASGTCLSPAVYLDGVPITNPTMLFAHLDIVNVERVEVIPAAEAGVRYGTGALFGAILIETRRPGADRATRFEPGQRINFDWTTDPAGHSTARVFLLSTVGNGAGLALGLAAAGQCIHLRRPAYDAIVSDCDLLPTIGAGIAAIVLPSLGSGAGSQLAGRTSTSKGMWAPATVGAAMFIIPGYALSMSGRRNGSDALDWVGRGLIAIGAPFAASLSDYLFRQLREN